MNEGMAERMSKYYELISGYRKVRDADMDEVSRLVTKARGPSRSVRQFAGEVEANPSTVSRLENKRTNSISPELAARIAEHAEEDNDSIFDQLMKAGGMERRGLNAHISQSREFAWKSEEIIRAELFRTGHSCVNASDTEIPSFGPVARPGLAIRTDAVGDGIWFMNCFYMDDERGSGMGARSFRVIERLSAFMSMFYCGAGDVKMCSLIVNSRQVFDFCKNIVERKLGDRKIKDLISLILVDAEDGYVADEWILPTEKDVGSIFPMTPPERKEDAGVAEGQYELGDMEEFKDVFGY